MTVTAGIVAAAACAAGMGEMAGGDGTETSGILLGQAAEPAKGLGVVPVGPGEGAVGKAVSMGWEQWVVVASLVAAPLVLVILWLTDVIRPGSLERKSGRDTSGQPAPIWFFAALVTFLATMIGAIMARSVPGLDIGDGKSIRDQAIVSGVGYLTGALAGAALAWLIASTPGGAKAGLTVKGKDVLTGLGAFLLVIPIVFAIMNLMPVVWELLTGRELDPIAHDGLRQIVDSREEPWRIIMIACAVIAAPIVEELIYRGFLQSALVRVCDSAGMNRWLGVLGASAIFAGVHFNSVPPHALAVLFVLGVCFGAAFERTGRLGVAMVMHAIFNATNIVIALSR